TRRPLAASRRNGFSTASPARLTHARSRLNASARANCYTRPPCYKAGRLTRLTNPPAGLQWSAFSCPDRATGVADESACPPWRLPSVIFATFVQPAGGGARSRAGRALPSHRMADRRGLTAELCDRHRADARRLPVAGDAGGAGAL